MQPVPKEAAANLEPQALSALADSDISLGEFAFRWLEIQCANFSGINCSVLLFRERDSTTFKPEAKWPLTANVARLADIATGVIDEQCGLLLPYEGENLTACAFPIFFNDDIVGIAALEVIGAADQMQQAPAHQVVHQVMGQLQWSVGWIELFLQKRAVMEVDNAALRSKAAVEILAKVQAQENLSSACQALVSSLATRYNADRVSLGLIQHDKVKIAALSLNTQLTKRMALVAAIERSMAEAKILAKDILYPTQDNEVAAPDHHHLRTLSSSEHVVSLPIFIGDRFRAVLTLELSHSLTQTDLQFIRAVAVLIVPTLEDKRLAERSVLRVAWDQTRSQFSKLTGRGYGTRKIVAAIVIALLVFFSFAKGTYRLSADIDLEGQIQRVLVAPFNGYIQTAQVRAGDVVAKGQVLYQLDDSELRLERNKWLSERAKFRYQYDEAYAEKKSAELNISRAQIDQATAQLSLVEDKLSRAAVVAPFDGLLISGDLSQRLGDFVEQGEVLFELAPLDSYRVILYVEDSRISDVANGQRGTLILAALPAQKYPFTISKITPVTEVRDGGNYFRVEATLDNTTVDGASVNISQFQPGMQGVGKIDVDERRLIGIWTRRFVEWLQLTSWRWLP